MKTVFSYLKTLPGIIEYQGCHFEFHISKSYENEVKIFYELIDVDEKSKHYKMWSEFGCWKNPFLPGANRTFLMLYEVVETNVDLVNVLSDLCDKLKKWRLIEGRYRRPETE